MAAPEVLTYASLVTDVMAYTQVNDDAFVAQIPRLIMLAENRIAAEVRGLGFLMAVTNALTLQQATFAKPARWRETYSFNIGIGTAHMERKFLKFRTYEYCRAYWPDPTVYGAPKLYADWDYQHWLLVPTPDYAYPFELLYHERPQPLSTENQTSWTTEYAPQLLLYATLLETMPFLKDDSRMQTWQAAYDRAMKQVAFEEKKRDSDRQADAAKAA